MVMSDVFQSRGNQYVAHRDKRTGTWRIIDLLKLDPNMVGPDSEVPDDSDAILILSEAQFLAVLEVAAKEGIVQSAVKMLENLEIEDLKKERERLLVEKEQLQKTMNVVSSGTTEREKSEPRSESFQLKAKAIDSVLKIVGLDSIKGNL